MIAADKNLDADARWLNEHGVVGTHDQLRVMAFTGRLNHRPLSDLVPADASRAGSGDGIGNRAAGEGRLGSCRRARNSLVRDGATTCALMARLGSKSISIRFSRWQHHQSHRLAVLSPRQRFVMRAANSREQPSAWAGLVAGEARR